MGPRLQALRYPGYGVAAVSTVAVILTAPGQTMLVSLLNLPLREAFGITPLKLNTAYAIATVAASLPLVWIGGLTDRLGPRRMLMIIATAFGAACLFMSSVANSAMVFAAFFGLRFLGQGSLSLVSSHALAMWFHRRLGTLSGIRHVVLFAAWAAVPTATQAAIDGWGWRRTWAAFGVGIPLLLVPLSLWLVRDRPEELGLGMDGDTGTEPAAGAVVTEASFTLRAARRTRAYWILVSAAILSPMIGTAMLFDIQPLLIARGIGAASAGACVSAWSATMALMALPAGRLVDRRSAGLVLALGGVSLAASCGLWLIARSLPVAIAAMVVFAVGQSLMAATVGATVARFFGRNHHGAIRSSLTRLGVIATGVGPLTFGISQQLAGSHVPALVGFALLCIPATVAARWLVPPTPVS